MSNLNTLLTALSSYRLCVSDRLAPSFGQTEITLLAFDSRKTCGGSMFFCLVGKTVDGHDYAPSAYRNGCRVFVTQRELLLPADACQIVVPDTRGALADIAALHYGHPERHFRLIGITGTKGKTTTALLIRSLLESVGIPTGYIGTNGVLYGRVREGTANTTPESVDIYRYLADMKDAGVTVCVLEISSQALWMGRTRGLAFDSVLFTNLSRDHIGGVEHPDYDHYRDSKRRLFTDYPTEAVMVCTDDPETDYMIHGVTAPIFRFGLQNAEEGEPLSWCAKDIRTDVYLGKPGVSFAVHHDGKATGEPWFLPLPGAYNVQNALAALTVVCERFGVSCAEARKALATAVAEGRFEAITHPALPDTTFVIDYAHNGASLTAILDALRAYNPKRLICLFGSVGGRTKERRRDLAEAAGIRCDLCILTSDNPAGESPEAIMDDIDSAFPEGSCPRVKIADREQAIRYAVEIAREGDMILLAGKGHEDYQLIGVDRVPFSENRILRDALERREEAFALY